MLLVKSRLFFSINPLKWLVTEPQSSGSKLTDCTSSICRRNSQEKWKSGRNLKVTYLIRDFSSFGTLSICFAGYVSEYLCLVPHDRKFVSATTGDIILQSARWIHGFSLTKVNISSNGTVLLAEFFSGYLYSLSSPADSNTVSG